ncbi:MAG: deoxyribose-phosphate aldolase [Bacteroidota bacterium]
MTISSYIDHTILKVDCTEADVKRLCQEAVDFQFAAVCIPPYFIQCAAQTLQKLGAKVKIATVIGFPMGYSSTPAKIEEIKRAIDDGADEVDAVINICAVKNKSWNYVYNEIDSMTTAAHLKGKRIKIILETGLLNEEEIEKLAEILLKIKPDFAKTSTGFNGTGAELEKVLFLQKLLQKNIAIKASGGIRSLEMTNAFIEAGATRIGTSSGIKIVQEAS